jgi:hypothetical protein
MATMIGRLLEHFILTVLVLGLITAGIAWWRRPRPLTASVVVEDVCASFRLCSAEGSCVDNFVGHGFFGNMAATCIGWEPSPCQAEAGVASLGYAVVGLLACRGGFGRRAAAVVGPAILLLGAAAGHGQQMLVAQHVAPGTAGVIFDTDMAMPIIGAALLWLQRRCDGEALAPRRVSGDIATPHPARRRQASPRAAAAPRCPVSGAPPALPHRSSSPRLTGEESGITLSADQRQVPYPRILHIEWALGRF